MTSDDIVRLRAELKLSQQQLAAVLGVHIMTVSKWERGLLSVSGYHGGLLLCFRDAVNRRPEVADEARRTLALAIPPRAAMRALYQLLRAAFDPEAAT